jgi:hypothetical protein
VIIDGHMEVLSAAAVLVRVAGGVVAGLWKRTSFLILEGARDWPPGAALASCSEIGLLPAMS